MAARRLFGLVVLLAVSLCMSGASLAQASDDLDALNREIESLNRVGNYGAATTLAKRALAFAEKKFGAEDPAVAMALYTLAELYTAQGRYTAAEPLYKRILAVLEAVVGPEDQAIATILTNLGDLYRAQERYAAAEPLFKRSLAINEAALGPAHPNVALALNNLAGLYQDQRRYAAAEPFYKRSLAIKEAALGPAHPDVALALNTLAASYNDQGRYAAAEPLVKRSLAIYEAAFGPEHPTVATLLNNLAELYRKQGRYAAAEPLYKRSLAIDEAALGAEHPSVAKTLNNLAILYNDQGRYAAAEPLVKRSLAIYEAALGPAHPNVALALSTLATLYNDQGRYAAAEPLVKRSLAIDEAALGPEHPSVATSLNNLASVYFKQGRYTDAEPLYKRSLAINEAALGPEHPDVARTLNNLASLYKAPGRHAEAEPFYKRSLAIYEAALGPEHPTVATLLNNLASLYEKQGRFAAAEPLYKRSLVINEAALGPAHPKVALTLHSLAWLGLGQHNWAQAAERWKRATAILQRRTERGLGGTSRGPQKAETERYQFIFEGLVKVSHRLAAAQNGSAEQSAKEAFETAQWGQGSGAAASLAQMAVRSATGSADLAALVRERQDLVAEWQAKDKLLIASKARPPAQRSAKREKAVADRLSSIDLHLADIDAQLAKDFPEYASLANAKPISVAEVQAQLQDDEALVLFLDTDGRFKLLPEETFLWVITKSDVRWLRSEVGTATLQREVAALRCGLDATAWHGDYGALRCADLLKLSMDKVPQDGDPLPFDRARAHSLYKSLLGEAEDLIKGKHLLVVPSGALTKLPFQVLVTEAPKPGAPLKDTAWLARSHAITVLPSVSSIKSLRRIARPSRADRIMLGFGNPLLDGQDPTSEWARKARAIQTCDKTVFERVASLVGVRGGVTPVPTRGGLADIAHLRQQTPLPETADELCAVARDLDADVRELRLGQRATETEIKRLNASGELARYRIVHFATHGTLAGQLSGTTEPGLILTPPDTATAVDDGYLSGSEIASLKLNADWVILSACNTAGGNDKTNAEALSGLARVFFYAGARALLVSHWAVYSEATVKLITKAVRAISNSSVGRAEALRRAMLDMIDHGAPYESHPSYWAPFVVVGEGAAARG